MIFFIIIIVQETGNYRFGYDESHPSGGTFRDETGDSYGNKWGSYGLHEADGRYRVVNYVADSNGFRAEIKSNEPGLAPTSTKTVAQKPFVETTEQKPFIESEQKPYVESSVKKPYVEPAVKKPFVEVQKPFVEIQKPFVEIQKPYVEVQKPYVEVQKPILYASPVIHHSYNPEYPLLYHQSPYYAAYGNYKGTPFRRYSHGSYYKGTPYVKRIAPIVTRHGGYYVYP